MKEVGLILPSHIRPGERISGSVVENPTDYDEFAGDHAHASRASLRRTGSASTLAGWRVEISG